MPSHLKRFLDWEETNIHFDNSAKSALVSINSIVQKQ
jgi:hypothetical protein